MFINNLLPNWVRPIDNLTPYDTSHANRTVGGRSKGVKGLTVDY